MKKYRLDFSPTWISEKLKKYREETQQEHPNCIIMHPRDYQNLWDNIVIDTSRPLDKPELKILGYPIYRSEDVERYEIIIL